VLPVRKSALMWGEDRSLVSLIVPVCIAAHDIGYVVFEGLVLPISALESARAG
jgi:hypothetical protein